MTDVHPTLLGASSSSTSTTHVSHAVCSPTRVSIRPNLDLPSLFPENDASSIISKRIADPNDVALWLHSEAFIRLTWFLQTVNSACTKLTCTEAKELFPQLLYTDRFRMLLSIFEKIDKLITETPPEPLQARYGNKAFRLFKAKLEESSLSFHMNLLKDLNLPPPCIQELMYYFNDSFGNTTRIDYGTGHELAFICWLTCLDLIHTFGPSTNASQYSYLGLVIFERYLALVRKLQRTYSLEPAGSHGVWGLDDYQFLPYYWGAAQLIDHPHFKPSVITEREIMEHYADDYLYFQAVAEVFKLKKGPFFEHSPMLYDISGVPTWQKVNTGMLKMYIAEVCRKFPIVQHMWFGVLLPFRKVDSDPVHSSMSGTTANTF